MMYILNYKGEINIGTCVFLVGRERVCYNGTTTEWLLQRKRKLWGIVSIVQVKVVVSWKNKCQH